MKNGGKATTKNTQYKQNQKKQSATIKQRQIGGNTAKNNKNIKQTKYKKSAKKQ